MALFFIRRPIVAIVISILIVMMGVFTLSGLSFEQYPFLAPPTIRITATYPGSRSSNRSRRRSSRRSTASTG